MSWQILEGDCIEQMRELDEASIDAIVTDPPYGLEFMGKEWDRLGATNEVASDSPGWRAGHGGVGVASKTNGVPFGGGGSRVRYGDSARSMQGWHEAWATEALRVLKPGGHLLAFGGTRTYHRLACAVEDAGFEIRDSLIWLYGSGFPKSLDVSKAIDKAERGVPQGGVDPTSPAHGKYRTQATEGKRGENDSGQGYGAGPGHFMAEDVKAESRELVPEAAQWGGWGTALKPGHEPIVVARKPLVGTVAQNVLEHGTGALNIDGCRIEGTVQAGAGATGFGADRDDAYELGTGREYQSNGRWPANVVLSPEAAAELDEQSGERPGMPRQTGGAARFFYTPKASRGERNAGLDGFEERKAPKMDGGEFINPQRGTVSTETALRNHHPTVKPIDLMRWLVRLVCPLGGTILDPFTGSGTTGIASVLEGFDFLGIEREPEYVEIAKARVEWWAQFTGEDTDEILIRVGLSERIERKHRESGQLGLIEDAA